MRKHATHSITPQARKQSFACHFAALVFMDYPRVPTTSSPAVINVVHLRRTHSDEQNGRKLETKSKKGISRACLKLLNGEASHQAVLGEGEVFFLWRTIQAIARAMANCGMSQ